MSEPRETDERAVGPVPDEDAEGAAAMLGSTTVSFAASERELGLRVMPKLAVPGKSIGDALQEAKEQLAATYPSMMDALLGWTILGDPTMEVAK